jgi:hypothetical protein
VVYAQAGAGHIKAEKEKVEGEKMKKSKISAITEVVNNNIEKFEAKHGNVKYVKGVMTKFGLKERTIRVKEIIFK